MGKGIYGQIGELAGSEGAFVFCRIVMVHGSTPRKTGAVMAVLPDGNTIGSVGGGKPEYDCIIKAKELMDTGREVPGKTKAVAEHDVKMSGTKSLTVHFDLYPGNSGGDYICGGERDIELTYVTAEDRQTREEILDIVRRRRQRKVYIFGGGHVAQALVPILAGVDFAPVVYEERPEFAAKELFPEADNVICHGFDGIGDILSLEDTDYCAIMTRGHSDDYTVLKQVLSTGVEYIGLMGSRSKRAILFEKLNKDGFAEADISRIHNPIGLDIGSETPAEIAVSIAAELIEVRSASERPG